MAANSLVTAIEDHVALSGPEGCDLISLWPIMQAAGIEKNDYGEILENFSSFCYYKRDQKVKIPTRLDENTDVRVVASLELRKKVLTRELTDKTINENQFLVLERIAQTKEKGVFQVQIGRDLGIDVRSVYWAIKGLEKLKLIVKRRTAANSTWTNIVHHVRFAPKNDEAIDRSDSIDYDVMQKRLVNTLSNARNNIMTLSDLLSSFNFTELHQQQWGRRFIERAIVEGYVTKLELVSDRRKTVGIKLVRLPSQEHVQASTPATETGEDDKAVKKTYTLAGLELQKRVTSCILNAGEKGITGKEITESLPNAHPGAIKRFLHAAIRTDEHSREIYNVIEPLGRSRLYRYFGRREFEKFMQYHEDIINPNDGNQIEGSKRKRVPEDKNDSSPKRTKTDAGNATGQKRKQPSSEGAPDIATGTSATTSTPAPRSGFISRTRQSMKGLNITMDKRKQSMATIIHRDKVRELNNDLGAEISQLAGEPPRKSAVARVTWIRMAEALQDTNTIKVVKSLVPTFGGGTEYKILFLHPDLNENDAIVRQYLDSLRMSKVVKPVTQKKRTPTVVHDDFVSMGRPHTAMTHQQATNDIVYTMPERFWREVALRHGWISSKWLRARVLHEYLFGQSNEERTVDLAHVIKNLPLGIFCQTIGISRFHEEVEEFMRLNDDLSIPLTQIPNNVRKQMIPPNSLFRKRLLKLIGLLGALELIESMSDRPDARILRLTDTGKIRNFSQESRPVVQQIQLDALDDVRMFWKELQFTCTCLYPNVAEDRKVPPATDPLGSICLSHTWNLSTSLTLEQRQTLESFVDRSQKTAPVHDEQLIHHIARELCLHPARIKRYFEGIMRIMRGNPPKIRPRKNPPSELVDKLVSTAKLGEIIPSVTAETLVSRNHVERTFAPTRKFLKHRYQAPDTTTPTARPPRREKQEWSATEDDVLLHCYTILNHRALLLQKPLTWKPVLKLIPRRDTEQYRRRLHHLRRANPSTVERLRQQWCKVYEEATQSGELVDKRSWDMFDFDLAGQLEYFILRLQSQFRSTSVPYLPTNRRALVDQYEVVPDEAHTQSCSPHTVKLDSGWDRSNPLETLKAKDIELGVASVVIKMSLLTPSEEYNPEDAYALLGRFAPDAIDTAMEKMRNEGLLMKWRRQGRMRLIPGRMFNFSEKFLKKFSSAHFPHNLLKKAINFYCECVDGLVFQENEYTQGAMTVLLDLLSNGQITLTFDGENQYYELRRSPYYPQLIHEVLCANWVDKRFNVSIHYEQEKISPATNHTNEQCNISLCYDLSNIPASAKAIYDAIDLFGREGCTLFLLKERLRIPDESIMDGVETLMSRSLVIRVGFSDIRLVTATYAKEWLAATKDGNFIKPRMWIDVKGRVIPNVLQGCANAVIEQIIMHPGITQTQLLEEFKGYMSSIEVYDLLLFLERNRAIKSKAFNRTASGVKLFDKKRAAIRPLGSKRLGDNRSTHYWTLPNYYLWVKSSASQ